MLISNIPAEDHGKPVLENIFTCIFVENSRICWQGGDRGRSSTYKDQILAKLFYFWIDSCLVWLNYFIFG